MMHRARLPLGFVGLMLCIVMALVGCEAADNSSLPTTQVVPVHWVQATPAAAADHKQSPVAAAYLGSASCNTTGCHGSADLNAPAWRNAQAKQLFNDPHTQAFRVLYGERSARMFERLEIWPPATADDKWTEFQKEFHQAADPAAREAVLTKNAEAYSTRYQQFLQKRCLGCHATPFETPADGTLIEWQHSLSGGVTCESCHGPAGEWGATHFLPKFSDNRSATAGFVDTKDLSTRAERCVGCHVGPMPYQSSPSAASVAHDMNHDLIAAGHPRLAFEFNAYWNALPAHWDVAGDKRRAEASAEKSSANLNLRMWAVGQWAAANQNLKLLDVRRRHAQPEFASYDCFDCHHELSDPSRRQWTLQDRRQESVDLFRPKQVGLPRLNAWSLLQAQNLLATKASDFTALSQALEPEIHFRPTNQPLSILWLPRNEDQVGKAHLELPSQKALAENLTSAASSPDGGWDRLIQAYLAIHAHALDRNDPVLTEALQQFAEFLADHAFTPNAKVQPAVIYDSPTLFRVLRPNDGTPPEPAWDEAQFQVLLKKLLSALSASQLPAETP